MSLADKINSGIKAAMKAKEKEKLRPLREIKSAILLANTDGTNQDLTEDKAIKLLQKLVKQHQDSFEIYSKNDRPEQAAQEKQDIEVITSFLPQQLSEAEVTDVVKGIIEQTGAASMKDMGKVMGMANQQLSGKADGKMISGIVKNLLS